MAAAAPDGSPVRLYARLDPMGEPELIHAALPPGCEILELGCGAGRLTHALVKLGHEVVAVDESAAMLAYLRVGTPVLADIVSLDLERRFPAVVLASHLMNHADASLRNGFLHSCATHVRPDGCVLIERLPPDWHPESTEHWTDTGGVHTRLCDVRRDGLVVHGVMEYDVDGELFVHSFTSRILGDGELDAALGAAGLALVGALNPQSTWIKAIIRQ